MLRNNDRISSYQLAMLLIATIVSVGVFSMPADIAEGAGSDAWFIVVLAGVINALAAVVIVKLNSRFPGKTIAEYGPLIIGKAPGKILLLIFAAYLTMVIAFETRAFTEIVKMFLLFRTPTEVIVLCLLLVAVYIVRGGIECIARMCEILFPLIFIPFLLILSPGVTMANPENLLPVFQNIPEKIMTTFPGTAYSFGGLELLLFYIGFMKKPKKALKPVLGALLFVTMFFTFTVALCVAYFGAKATPYFIWPLLSYIRSINIPGLFIERLDGIALSIWTLTVFSTIIAAFYITVYSISKALNTKESKQFALPLVIVVYYLALQPDSIVQLFEWGDIIFPYFTSALMYVVPVLLLILSYVRGLGGGENEKA